MKLKTRAFKNGEKIPVKYTCDGMNINPPLEIGEVPDDAASLALIVDDPDAPNGSFTHWLMWNISRDIEKIEEGSTPANGVRIGRNSRGTNDYIGPCPPNGTHHYRFMLYALDTKLDLPDNSVKGDLEKAMGRHIVKDVEMIGTYSRSKED